MDQPVVVQKPLRAQVDFNIFPDALPGPTIDAQAFYTAVAGTFGSTFDMKEIRKSIPDNVDASRLSPEAMLTFSLQNDRFVQFVGGVLREGEKVTRIDKMGFGNEQVSAVVAGTTDQAMFVCQTLIMLLWKAANVTRQWAAIEPSIERIRYKSTTDVEMPFPLIELLNRKLFRYIRGPLSTGAGKDMGMVPASSTLFKEQVADRDVVVHCKRIELVVTTFDRTAGESEDCSLSFLIHSRADANRRSVYVTSELPFDKHTRLVEEILAHVQRD